MSKAILCSECQSLQAILYCADDQTYLCLDCSNSHLDHRITRLNPCHHCKERQATHICSFCKSEDEDNYQMCVICKPLYHANKAKEQDEGDVKKEQHVVKAIPKPRKPTVPFSQMFASDARIISTRKQVKVVVGQDQKEDMNHIRAKIKKMLAIANNAGTSDEAKQASQVAANWMAKYQLSQFDVATAGQLEEGDYMIQVRNAQNEDQTDKEWIYELSNQVARMFPSFVKTYSHGISDFDKYCFGKTHADTYCFLGVEDSAWNACELFCELFGIIAHAQAMAKFTKRFTRAVALDSYAYGMVKGMPLQDFVDAPALLRDFSEGDREKMLIIREAGNAVVERIWNRKTWSKDTKIKNVKRRDYAAMRAGQEDGANIKLSDKRVKRIEM